MKNLKVSAETHIHNKGEYIISGCSCGKKHAVSKNEISACFTCPRNQKIHTVVVKN